MSTTFLIRHGESETNNGVPSAHLEGDRLTTRGVEQARQVARYLYTHITSLDLIVTSSYQRTKETADFIRPCFPNVPFKQWDVQEFTYLSSLHHMVTTREQRKPLVRKYWSKANPYHVDGSGSETFAGFIKRAYSVLEQIEQLEHMGQQTIAIISHEQFITALLWIIDHKPQEMNEYVMRNFNQYLSEKPIPNGGIIRLQHDDESFTWKPITEHLEHPMAVY